MCFISWFDFISIVVSEQEVPDLFLIFFLYPLSAANAVVVTPNSINTLLGNVVSAFFINGNPTYFNGQRGLPMEFT